MAVLDFSCFRALSYWVRPKDFDSRAFQNVRNYSDVSGKISTYRKR